MQQVAGSTRLAAAGKRQVAVGRRQVAGSRRQAAAGRRRRHMAGGRRQPHSLNIAALSLTYHVPCHAHGTDCALLRSPDLP